MSTCEICGNQAKREGIDPLDTKISVNCNLCGSYILTDSFTVDGYADKSNFYKVSSWIREQNDLFHNAPEVDLSKFDEILEMKDKKIQEKFDFMMQFLAQEDKSYQLNNELLVKCWISKNDEAMLLFNKALEAGLLKGEPIHTFGGSTFMFSGLTYDGLQYIESLDEPNKSSKSIFVAFNFEDSLHEVFNTYVKQAIEELGFNYVVVNQYTTEHDKAISDEIIAKLKSSRIVVADFTNHRNSVYFEAGFAMGMKIPIIWTCQEGHTEDLSFDTRQYPHLVWEDGEDLKEQIINRIKVIL